MRKKLTILAVLGLIVFLNTVCSKGSPDLTVKSIECREGKLFFSLANEGNKALPDDWVAMASLYIDGIAQEILKRCDGETRFRDLVADLANSFEADPAAIERDVAAFLQEMRNRALVEIL